MAEYKIKATDAADMEEFRGRSLIPEQILWLEVIYQAYHDIQHFWESGAKCPVKLYLAWQAHKWIFSSADKHKHTSFLWCCDAVFDDPTHCIAHVRSRCLKPLPNYMRFLRDVEKQRQEESHRFQEQISNQIQITRHLTRQIRSLPIVHI